MKKIRLLEFLKRELQYDFGFHEILCDGLLDIQVRY